MMQRLPNRRQERLAGILLELEPGSRAVLHIERLDTVVQPAGCSHNRHRTILQAVHLIQPRGFVARRHEEQIGSGLDFVRQQVVVSDLHAHPARIRRRQSPEQVFVLALARSQHHQHQVFAHQLVCLFRNQIEALLIRKARHDSDQRPAQVLRGQSKHFQQILLAHLLPAQIFCRISDGDQPVLLGVPRRVIHAV